MVVKKLQGDDPRDLYAFVDSVHRNDTKKRNSRIILHLDCVDLDAFDASTQAARADENLALVRVITTARALRRHFDIRDLAEGDWLAIRVRKRAGMPRAWMLRAEADYQMGPSTNLVSMSRVPDGNRAHAELVNACRFMQSPVNTTPLAAAFMKHAVRFTSKMDIIVLDVGQASSAVIRSNGKPIGFFDVGAPLWFNQKSMPSGFLPPAVRNGFVMLSHWDFDHIDQARRFPQLLNLDWYAPDQPVGPNTVKLQEKIGGRLTFVHGSASFRSVLSIAPGTSIDPKDRNGTGYAMQVVHGNETAVLLGDSDYSFVDPALLVGATAITIPHHGGAGSTPPAPAGGRALAVASYGNPNSYKHPNEPHLSAHELVGWTIARTANHPYSGVKRGNRRLI